jgi:hypothetical protein
MKTIFIPRKVSPEKREYSIFWQQYAPESELGQHLSAVDYFASPYFMDGTDKRKYEETHELYLDELSLLKGMLVGYEDEPPTVDIEYSRSLFPAEMKNLQLIFNKDSAEELVKIACVRVSDEHGARAGYHAWRGAMALFPENSSLRFHCAIDLFELLYTNSFDPVKGKEILSGLVEEINIDDLTDEADIIFQLDHFKRWIEKH